MLWAVIGVNELKWRRIPLLGQEGWPRHQTLERRGRGGHSGRTTPSALSEVASRYFLDAQLPLLSQEGNTTPLQPALTRVLLYHDTVIYKRHACKSLAGSFTPP